MECIQVEAVAGASRPNSEGGKAHIIDINDNGNTFDVECVAPKKASKEAVPSRISPTTLDMTSRKRSSDTES